MKTALHVISFNVPYPANYGGVIDVYYKIKALAKTGCKVHLHCFQYGREEAEILEEVCASVHYYKRLGQRPYMLFNNAPFIVYSRQSEKLLANLTKDNLPILFEGLHTCYHLNSPLLKGRMKAIRMHNVEWEYYFHLGIAEKNLLKRAYFEMESRKLKKFEQSLHTANYIFPISKPDTTYYQRKKLPGNPAIHHLPAFHANDHVMTVAGMGEYAFYHGNLSVNENHKAAVYLLKKVFNDIDFPLIIAGLNPKEELMRLVDHRKNVQLIANPDEVNLKDLIANAQFNILPTFQATGIKLKLINTLFNGRFTIVNEPMVKGTQLESLCLIANDADKIKQLIKEFQYRPFTEDEIAARQKILEQHFSNRKNAMRLQQYIFG